ncbi:hypothetical protein ASPZODRAFT_142288 [Penicilliopsis zonata CBS 506.65]|uniref:FAD-binding domain-containing protein n=1 Tax=Penicilliopsis zonata CBS 506.65 TaxID=1073090 RepID=A0A1L9SHC0_9EURO|nr:hypothetical protein ASPZODRAFT_142288 [Penicilliopsis zonata CBS 506.65]OJJ46474.1 hypothetical protein ASPZODRAFT_142288 [Penicilliopsis zonata CBS 506.65]
MLTIERITDRYPHLAQLVGSGSFFALGNHHVLITQRGAFDSCRVYLWLTLEETADLTVSTARDRILGDEKLFGTFDDSVKEIIAAAYEVDININNSTLDLRPLYTLPHGHSWNHHAGVTLVGDAAHLMLPNGEGVNSAMWDSLLLSRELVKAYTTSPSNIDVQTMLDPLLSQFEADIVTRAQKIGLKADFLLDKMFEDDAAYVFSTLFNVSSG